MFLLHICVGVSADDMAVRSEITPKLIKPGDKFTLSLIIDYEEAAGVNVIEPHFPEEVKLENGPFIRPSVMRQDDGSVIRKVSISYAFTAEKIGRISLGSFIIRAGVNSVVTKPINVSIVQDSKNRSVNLYELRWNPPQQRIYAGQTASIILEMMNLNEILLPEDINFFPPADGFFERTDEIGTIRKEETEDGYFYTVPAAAFLLTASKPGTIEIPAATVKVGGLSKTASPARIEVIPLPEAVQSTGAVGSFSYKTWVDAKEIRKGEEVRLHVRIEGWGNMNYLQFPEPIVRNLMLIGKEEIKSLKPFSKGFRGARELIYRYIPNAASGVQVQVPAFPWLDVQRDRVRTERRVIFSIAVPAEAASSMKNSQDIPYALRSPREIADYTGFSLHKNQWNLLWLLPGIIMVVVFLVFRKVRFEAHIATLVLLFCTAYTLGSADIEVLKKAEQSYLEGKFSEALKGFTSINEISKGNPFLHYNIAVTNFRLHKYGEAIYYIRQAIREKPLEKEFRDTLLWMEQNLGLDKQVEPGCWINPDIFYSAFLVFANISCVFLVVVFVKKRGVYAIILGFAGLLTFGCLIGFVNSVHACTMKTAIAASEGIEMKKIPSDSAGTWLTLQEGTCMKIKSVSHDYFLVETGFGMEGWVRKDKVLHNERTS